jgi:hypothetical protein
MTLSKNQKQYRKVKEDGEKNFRRVVREDGTFGVRVTKKRMCVKVSQEAFQRLKDLGVWFKMNQQDTMTHLINHSTPNYGGGRQEGTKGYHWKVPEVEGKVRRKATDGTKMLSLNISHTAWMNLEVWSKETRFSKARLVQSLLLTYTPISLEVLQKTKERRDRDARYYKELEESRRNGSWTPEPATEEQMEDQANRLLKMEEERLARQREFDKALAQRVFEERMS